MPPPPGTCLNPGQPLLWVRRLRGTPRDGFFSQSWGAAAAEHWTKGTLLGGGVAESAVLEVRLRKKSERERAKGKAGKTPKECLKGLGLWRARGVWGGETFTLSSPGCLAPVGIVAVRGGWLSGIQPPSQPLPFPHSMAEQRPTKRETAASRPGRATLTPFHGCHLLLSATTTIKTLIKAHALISEASRRSCSVCLLLFKVETAGVGGGGGGGSSGRPSTKAWLSVAALEGKY